MLKGIQRLCLGAGNGVMLLTLACLVVQLTVRDSWPVVYVLQYIPAVGLAALLGLVALLPGIRGERVPGLLLVIACLVTGWIWQERQFNPQQDSPKDLRVVLWNIGRSDRHDELVERLAPLDPDIVVLIENGHPTTEELQIWEKALRDYDMKMEYSMSLISRWPLESWQLKKVRRSRFIQSEFKFGRRHVKLIAADIWSNPWVRRKEALGELTNRCRPEPTIVCGDFNAPASSVHFDQLRSAGYQHVFEAAGRGLGVTWPYPIPVLGLDQIWVSPHFEVLRCEIQGHLVSDHRWVVADLRWRKVSTLR